MRKTLAAPLALLCMTAPAVAQETDTPIALDRVVVSGGLTPVDAESFARANSIITREQLVESNVQTVADALRELPGLHVSRTGSAGGLTEVRLRGAESNQVAVFIDGVAVPHSPIGFNWDSLTADNIERIEVLRGPQSALYGAGATAGVINIYTVGGIRNGYAGSASVERGSHLSFAGSASVQFGVANAGAGLSVSYRDDQGYDASGDGGEKDGFENLTVNFRGSADITDGASLRGSVRYTDRENEFDDTSFGCGNSDCYVVDTVGSVTEGTDFYAGLAGDFDLGSIATFTPQISWSRSENDNRDSGSTSDDEATTLRINPQLALYFGERVSLIGMIDYRDEKYQSNFNSPFFSASSGDNSRRSIGYALDYQGDITDVFFFQAGLRFDDNDVFEDAWSFAASASYAMPTGTTLRASIGRGQTNPTFVEQFGFSGNYVGNPDLQPEQNFSWDFGVSQELLDGRLRGELTYFNERLENEIVDLFTTSDNLDGTTRKQGVEVALAATPIDDLDVTVSYTWLDTKRPDGISSRRRPKHSGAIGVDYRFLEDRARLGADMLLFGQSLQGDFGDSSFSSPVVKQAGYIRLDLNGSFDVTENFELYGTIRNALDADYEEVRGYDGQPFAAFLGLRAKW